MKFPFLLFVVALFLFSSCKKEGDDNPTTPTENYWKLNGKTYSMSTLSYYQYRNFDASAGVDTTVQYLDVLSRMDGQDNLLRLVLQKSVSLAQNTSLNLDTQMKITLQVPVTSNPDSIYRSSTSSHVMASVRISGGKASISVPETWLYTYRSNGKDLVPVDSARFSCNIQVPSSPTIIYPKANYWKLNDTVFTFQNLGGISPPSATNPYTFYSLTGKNGNNTRILDLKFVDPRTTGSTAPANVRIGNLFKVQLYGGNSSALRDTTYHSADTSEVFAAIGGQSTNFTLTIPETWVYSWKRDAQGNPVRDSARFSCDIQGYR